jgi:mono/diheme cytochrome c family protein
MRQLLAYIWMRPYLQGSGDAARGKKVCATKNCASCHESAPAPRLCKIPDGYSDVTMISTLWEHGPRMLA